MSDDEGETIDVEAVKLARQRRHLENDRAAQDKETKDTLRKQGLALKALEADNERLNRELKVVEDEIERQQSSGSTLRELRLAYDGYAAEIKDEHERVRQLDRQINRAREQLQGKQAQLSNQKGEVKGTAAYMAWITTMENRVEQSLRTYNGQLAENAKLRHKVEHLKKERLTFGEMKSKLARELDRQKQSITEIIEQSNHAYEARDEALGKMQLLKEKSGKEAVQSNAELKELNRNLAHEKKQKDFMVTKGRDRTKEFEAAERARRLKEQANDKPQDVIDRFTEFFDRMKVSAGVESNDELVNKFITVEAENFALFNLVNELNNDVQTKRESIADQQEKIAEYSAESARMDARRSAALSSLEGQLADTQQNGAKFAAQAASGSSELDELIATVRGMFEHLKCDRTELDSMLGEKELGRSNVMVYLGIIEQRANEMLLQQSLLSTAAVRKWEEDADKLLATADNLDFDPASTLGAKPEISGLLGLGPKPRIDGPITIVPPSTVDDQGASDDEEGADVRPLTHAEIKARIISSMNKRESVPASATQEL